MSYPVVLIEAEIGNLDLEVQQAKKDNNYNAQKFDTEIQKVLVKWCPIAEHSVKTNSDLIHSAHEQAKQAMDLAEKYLKKKDFNKDDLNLVEHLPGSIQQYIKRMSEDLNDLTKANVQYRGGWPATARKALSPQKQAIVEPYLANRQKQIDATPALMGLKKRVEEYLPRAEEFLKQARQKMNAGQVEISSMLKDIEEVKGKMETGRDLIKDLHFKKNAQITKIKNLDKVKKWSPDEIKSAKAFLIEVVANAKNARGQRKTLETVYEGLEKRGKASGPGWKDMAAKAVSQAGKPFKEAIDASKAFDADEEKCTKICKDHGVTL